MLKSRDWPGPLAMDRTSAECTRRSERRNTRHDVHVAAIYGHAGLELGIGRGELRRVLGDREPAGRDGANADQNGCPGDPCNQSMRKVCSIRTSVQDR